MMDLNATFIDADLHLKFQSRSDRLLGVVHSVYETLINVRTEGGEMFTLSQDKMYYIPGTIQIGEKVCFNEIDGLVGEKVVVTSTYVKVKNTFHVRLEKAEVLYPSFRTVQLTEHLMESLTEAKRVLLTLGKRGGCISLFACFENMDLMERELSLRISYLKEEPLFNRLIGLGRGLTPSGDDFCLGFLCMTRYFRNTETDLLRKALRKEILKDKMNTTEVSREMLLQGVKERYIEPLTRFCETVLSSESGQEYQDSMMKLLNIGSTSGTDMATGAIFALEMFLEN